MFGSYVDTIYRRTAAAIIVKVWSRRGKYTVWLLIDILRGKGGVRCQIFDFPEISRIL